MQTAAPLQTELAEKMRAHDERLRIFNDRHIGRLVLHIAHQNQIHGIAPLTEQEMAQKVFEILDR